MNERAFTSKSRQNNDRSCYKGNKGRRVENFLLLLFLLVLITLFGIMILCETVKCNKIIM